MNTLSGHFANFSNFPGFTSLKSSVGGASNPDRNGQHGQRVLGDSAAGKTGADAVAISSRPEVTRSTFKPITASAQSANTGDAQPAPAAAQIETADAAGKSSNAAAQARKQEAQEQLLIDDQIKILAARDREVRAHEQAHVAAGGQYAGAAVYEYERGPNGRSYAVGGEVSISTGEASTPQETLRKAQIIRRAALAPAEPSPQDRRVAAMATQMETAARSEMAAAIAKEQEASLADDDTTTGNTATDSHSETSAPGDVSSPSGSPPAANPAFETSASRLLSSARRPVVGERTLSTADQQQTSERLQQKLFTDARLQRSSPGALFSQMV